VATFSFPADPRFSSRLQKLSYGEALRNLCSVPAGNNGQPVGLVRFRSHFAKNLWAAIPAEQLKEVRPSDLLLDPPRNLLRRSMEPLQPGEIEVRFINGYLFDDGEYFSRISMTRSDISLYRRIRTGTKIPEGTSSLPERWALQSALRTFLASIARC